MKKALVAAAILAGISLLAVPVTQRFWCDEGWNLYYARHYRETGTFTTVFLERNISMVFFKPQTVMLDGLSRVVDGYEPVWLFRLPALLLAIASLLMIDATLRRLGVRPEMRLLAACWSVVWLQQTSYGAISIRPDMAYLLALAYAGYAQVRAAERPGHLVAALAASLLAFSIHPNAVFTAVPILLGAPAAVRAMRATFRPWMALASAAAVLAAGAATAAVLVANFSGFGEMWRAVRDFGSLSSHSQTLTAEAARYRALWQESKLVSVLLILGIAASGRALVRGEAVDRKLAATALLLLAAMALLGAKWSIYFIVVLPSMVAVVVRTLESRVPRVRWGEIATLAASLALLASTAGMHVVAYKSNTMLRVDLGRKDRHDRERVNAIVGTETLHANPHFFPYVKQARFIPYWNASNTEIAPWRTARFKIDLLSNSDPDEIRHRFRFNGVEYALSENRAFARPF